MVRWAVDLSALPPLPGFAQILAAMFENRLSRVGIVQGSVEICPAKADREVELIADALEYMLVGALNCHEWCCAKVLRWALLIRPRRSPRRHEADDKATFPWHVF